MVWPYDFLPAPQTPSILPKDLGILAPQQEAPPIPPITPQPLQLPPMPEPAPLPTFAPGQLTQPLPAPAIAPAVAPEPTPGPVAEPPAPEPTPQEQRREQLRGLLELEDPYATPLERAATQQARIDFEAQEAAQLAMETARQRRTELQQEREEETARQRQVLEDKTRESEALRREYRQLAERGVELTGKDWAAMAVMAISDALAVGMSRGRLQSQIGANLQNFIGRKAAGLAGRRKAKEQEIALLGDEIQREERRIQLGQRDQALAEAAILDKLAQETQLISQRAQTDIEALNASTASSRLRAQAEVKAREAAIKEAEALGKLGREERELALKEQAETRQARESRARRAQIYAGIKTERERLELRKAEAPAKARESALKLENEALEAETKRQRLSEKDKVRSVVLPDGAVIQLLDQRDAPKLRGQLRAAKDMTRLIDQLIVLEERHGREWFSTDAGRRTRSKFQGLVWGGKDLQDLGAITEADANLIRAWLGESPTDTVFAQKGRLLEVRQQIEQRINSELAARAEPSQVRPVRYPQVRGTKGVRRTQEQARQQSLQVRNPVSREVLSAKERKPALQSNEAIAKRTAAEEGRKDEWLYDAHSELQRTYESVKNIQLELEATLERERTADNAKAVRENRKHIKDMEKQLLRYRKFAVERYNRLSTSERRTADPRLLMIREKTQPLFEAKLKPQRRARARSERERARYPAPAPEPSSVVEQYERLFNPKR